MGDPPTSSTILLLAIEKDFLPQKKVPGSYPLEDVESIVRRPTNSTETNPPSNQLAFTVEDSIPSVSLKNLWNPLQTVLLDRKTFSFFPLLRVLVGT